MRADVSRLPAPLRRLAPATCALILAGVACSSIPAAELRLPEGRSFLAMIPDSVDDVGVDPSITVSDDGVPYVTYFGFPATLEEGEIPVTRPVGAPYLTTEDGDEAGAVLLTSVTPDTQVWNRGAVAQPRATPAGVTVPFGPAEDPSLTSLTPENAEGTDVAVSGSDVHAVWAASSGVHYGLGPDFQLETIESTPGAGAPSIALDDSGAPLVAYVVAATQPRVVVAEQAGERWRPTTVATLPRCGADCPPPAQLAIVGGEPFVVVVDPDSSELIGVRRQGSTWSTEVIATGVEGGASLGAAGDTAAIAYYTSNGIEVSTGAPGDWQTEQVADVTPSPSPTASPSPSASGGGGQSPSASPAPESEPIRTEPTTGVAVDGDGNVWVGWEDVEGIHLATTGEGGRFQEEELNQTEGGVTPSVAVTEDGGSAFLAWFDPREADLRVGVSADLGGVLLAAPSPTPPPTSTGGAGCGDEGEPILDIVAAGTAFDKTCLVAPAGQPFTVDFDNQDPFAHNLSIYEDAAYTKPVEQMPQDDSAPVDEEVEYDFKPIDQPGTLYFQCDFHPIPAMRGTFEVIEASGGGGGGGQGGGGGNGGGGGGG